MYVPDKLKLNKFRDVKCPTNRDYFIRNGLVNPNGFTGDDVPSATGRKLDELSEAEQAELRELENGVSNE